MKRKATATAFNKNMQQIDYIKLFKYTSGELPATKP